VSIKKEFSVIKIKNFSFNFADVSLPITRENSIDEDLNDV
jgi:hypothetical protein